MLVVLFGDVNFGFWSRLYGVLGNKRNVFFICPCFKTVSVRGKKKKACATPRLVSFGVLIENFQQASLPLSYESPPGLNSLSIIANNINANKISRHDSLDEGSSDDRRIIEIISETKIENKEKVQCNDFKNVILVELHNFLSCRFKARHTGVGRQILPYKNI